MLDDLRSYLQMASGLTEATTAKAKDVVSGLLASGMSLTTKVTPAPEMMGQVQELADDLVATSKNNRDTLTAMIRSEVDKAVGRMGFVREDELAALRRHVQRLEKQIADIQTGSYAAPTVATWPTAAPDEADVIADAAAEAVVEEAAVEAAAEEEIAEVSVSPTAPSTDAAPADVVGESVDVPKKKKKIIVDPTAGA